jgi:hypothetical protein
MSKLNSKTLMVAAAVLMVLALLFMATPLLRVSGLANRTGFPRTFNGQTAPGGQNTLPGLGNGTQGQGNPGTEINPFNPNNPNNSTGRPLANGGRSLFGLGLLSGITGTIFYGIALLVSLAAAVGMFLTKRWGQVLGIVMGIVYLILAVVSFLPTILLGFGRGLNFLSLGLTGLHLVLAVAVIVLALIPAKKMLVQAVPIEPVTPATPPAASA